MLRASYVSVHLASAAQQQQSTAASIWIHSLFHWFFLATANHWNHHYRVSLVVATGHSLQHCTLNNRPCVSHAKGNDINLIGNKPVGIWHSLLLYLCDSYFCSFVLRRPYHVEVLWRSMLRCFDGSANDLMLNHRDIYSQWIRHRVYISLTGVVWLLD